MNKLSMEQGKMVDKCGSVVICKDDGEDLGEDDGEDDDGYTFDVSQI